MNKLFGKNDSSYIPYLTIKDKALNWNEYLIIKAIIKNNGTKNVTQCLIKINIYNQRNKLVGMDKSYVFGDIAPGKTKSFHLITGWPNSAKTYNLTIEKVRVN
jgi:hypothetical protein